MIQELRKEYPNWEVEDEKEDLRLEGIRLSKMRGKGAPKKRRSAAGEIIWIGDAVSENQLTDILLQNPRSFSRENQSPQQHENRACTYMGIIEEFRDRDNAYTVFCTLLMSFYIGAFDPYPEARFIPIIRLYMLLHPIPRFHE